VIQVRNNLLEPRRKRCCFPEGAGIRIGVIVPIPLLFGLRTGKFTRQSNSSRKTPEF
jgi:aryl-alcohol dehydrogenase-like predicted oxidoreductase